jgi:predicted RNase H-like nuclease (RuvC/YqgF family)
MVLENSVVIENLSKQKEDIEAKVNQFAQQRSELDNELNRLQAMYSKVIGALEVLTQIEESKVEKTEEATEEVTEEVAAE